MDNALLVAVVTELRDRLTGAVLGDAVQMDSRRFALRFSVPPFPRLGITLHPELSSLHLLRRVATPKEPAELGSLLTRHLGGMPLAAIRKQDDERVVELEFGDGWTPGKTLVLELMGKASNLLLLDAERKILLYLHSHKGTFRRPEEGGEYAPPPPRPQGDRMPWGSRLLADEVARRVARGEAEGEVRAALDARMREGAWEPVLYTPSPPAEIAESDELGPAVCFAAPFPLAAGEGICTTRYELAAEAAAAHAALVERHLLFRDLRSGLGRMVETETGRLGSLAGKLAAEAARAGDAGELRRKGEMLMASLSTAVKRGAEAEVTDFFDPSTPRIRIAIDPALDLKGNAEKLFRRARKMERGASVIAGRRGETAERLAALEVFAERLRKAAGREELEAIESDLNGSGLVRKIRAPSRPRLDRRSDFMKIKEYRTPDGYVVLVGRTAADNDALTFRIASPHDFWLHAAGRSGAHVVVRNPGRRRDLPERTLLEAAGIAAWFSRGDRECDVEVHYTRRKEVRKGKGMSPGMVMLRAFRTVKVRPALPPALRSSPPPAGKPET